MLINLSNILWSFCQVIYNPGHERGIAVSLSPRRVGLMMLNALEKYEKKKKRASQCSPAVPDGIDMIEQVISF